jgi:transposase
VGESDAAYAAALADWELTAYREKLEETLALAELPRLSRPREELQAQLATVLAEQAERTGSGDAQP